MRIRISNKAWHLRLVRNVFDIPYYKPTDLCSHFWSVLFAVIIRCLIFVLSPSFLLLPAVAYWTYKADKPSFVPFWRNAFMHTITGVVTIVVYGLGLSFIFFVTHEDLTTPIIAQENKLLAVVLFVAGVYLIQLIAFGSYLLNKKLRKTKVESIQKESKTLDTLSLVWEFVKAKKIRVCPLIEVVEEKQDVG